MSKPDFEGGETLWSVVEWEFVKVLGNKFSRRMEVFEGGLYWKCFVVVDVGEGDGGGGRGGEGGWGPAQVPDWRSEEGGVFGAQSLF